jgi:hypothetical protein
MIKYLYPKIPKEEFFFIIKYAILGALIAGAYGVTHDQITYTISSEYFTQIKFKQFHYADFGFGKRVFVATIGFLATWWVGFFAGWLFARLYSAKQNVVDAHRMVIKAFIAVFACGFASAMIVGAIGYLFINQNNIDQSWGYTLKAYDIKDAPNFMRVVYIHYASYAGGLTGIILSLVFIKPSKFLQKAP